MKKLLKPGIHWLYLFIPITYLLQYSGATAPVVFFSAALAVIPVAMLVGHSTEQIAKYTGDVIGGLLTATFGLLPELIFGFLSLRAGLYDLLLAAIGGGILLNLLFSTGLSFFIGGTKFQTQVYNPTTTKLYNSMMLLAVVSLMIPSGFHQLAADELGIQNERLLNMTLSVVLLLGYALYLIFMIKTHPYLFKSVSNSEDEEEDTEKWPLNKAFILLIIGCVFTALVSEILVEKVEETGRALRLSEAFVGLIIVAIVSGAGELIAAITMASKNKMDLSLGIAQGSSIQIALFLAPLFVLMSQIIGPEPFNLTFGRGLVIALFVSALLVSSVTEDGQSNWYKGIQLLLLYFLFAVLLYFIP